jgi:hypothetical protein
MGRSTRIKAETNIAVSWVIDTADAHGNDVQTYSDTPPPPPPSAPSKAGRLKGKARKEANTSQKQQIPAAAPPPKADTAKNVYLVTVEEILRQTTFPEQLGDTVFMPKHVSRAFKIAIRGRQQYADKFEEEQPGDPANATHVSFIATLENIISRLPRFVHVQTTAKTGQTSAPVADCNPLSNLFNLLDMVDDEDAADEETATESDDALPAPQSTVPRYEPKIDP